MTCLRDGILGVTMIAIVGAGGCGDDALPGCDPDVTCHASTDGGDASTGGDDESTAASMSADDDGTTDAGTTSTEDDAGSTSADTDTDGDSSTGASDDAEYRAVAIVGGLDRIRIFKHDLASDRCTIITLVAPSLADVYDVDTPRGWSVESIEITNVADPCESDAPAMFDAEPATAATGSIEFGEPGIVYPCLVSPDVDAAFAGRVPGIPPMDTLSATDVPVEGC